MTEGRWGIGGGAYRDLVSVPNTLGDKLVQSEYRGIQGLNCMHLYVRVNFKRQKSKYRKKDTGRKIERVKREMKNKVARFNLLDPELFF